MKKWRSIYVAQAEILQIILLANLFGQRSSDRLYFQGDTALRWCYGGTRFSEDPDFETHLSPDEIDILLTKALPAVKRDVLANLGPGKFELQKDLCSSPFCKVWAKFSPDGFRGKIAVKLDLQRTGREMLPETQLLIIGTLPSVVERINDGRLQIDANAILVVETLPEIMAGKIRAVFERPVFKGRDFWDLWFLHYSLRVAVDPAVFARKLRMYDFTMRRSRAEVLTALSEKAKPVVQAIAEDLRRFVPPAAFAALERTEFATLIASVREVIAEVPDAALEP
ncbi:MAG: nucleotidyl transferase AbiEii/AbiGii toxin family protein [Thermodesulfobacteriota bacterium]